jgi:hypothetical protein
MRGSTHLGLTCKYLTRVGVTESNKYSSLLQIIINYGVSLPLEWTPIR